MRKVAIILGIFLGIFLLVALVVPTLNVSKSVPRILTELPQLHVALRAYEMEYGTMPEISRIGPALFGDNPRKIVFYEVGKKQTNEAMEILDPWGTPYRFAVSSDGFVIVWSAGEDKQFDYQGHPSSDDWRDQIEVTSKGIR